MNFLQPKTLQSMCKINFFYENFNIVKKSFFEATMIMHQLASDAFLVASTLSEEFCIAQLFQGQFFCSV